MDVLIEEKFSIADYCVFGATLLVSTLIGVYFAYGGKQSDTKTYLMAGRDMHWFPVFVSLLVSFLSAITLLGVPAEIYTYGLQFIVLCFSYFIVITVGVVVFLPIFYRMQVVSSNEYLERRFSSGMRSLGCFLVSLQFTLYLAVVIYAPSLALEAIAGVPLSANLITTGLVCTFYTTLGGMKAVIWTDVFQGGIIVIGMLVVAIVGTAEVGSFQEVIRRLKEGGRDTIFDFNPDPTVRNTFWTLVIGGTLTMIPLWTVCQPAVQRFQACKSLKESKKAYVANIPGLLFIQLLCIADGAILYAVYAYCDIGAYGLKLAKSNDQVLPYFILHKLGKYPGVAGLFISCLFSGALSTASSGMNSVAAIVLEDVVKKIKPDISDKASTRVSKIFACLLGLIVIGLAFFVSVAGTMVVQLTASIFGSIGSPYFGLFCLGMLVPWANWRGAYCGIAVGLSASLWVTGGGILYPSNKNPQVVRMTNCSASVWNASYWRNGTVPNKLIVFPSEEYRAEETEFSSWYHVSYLYYGAIGATFTFVSGCFFSLVFRWSGCCDDDEYVVNKELLFDYGQCFYSCLPSYITDRVFTRNPEDEAEIDMHPMPINTQTDEKLTLI